jgi:hypothetical protein
MSSRIARIAVGAILLAIPMSYNGVLGALAYLPLVAIYPILTGLLGYGFVELLNVSKVRIERFVRLGNVSRTISLAIGAGLIAAVMATPAVPVWLALVGIFPVLMGILGSELVGESIVTRRALQRAGIVESAHVQAHPMSERKRPAVTAGFGEQQAA